MKNGIRKIFLVSNEMYLERIAQMLSSFGADDYLVLQWMKR